MPSPAIQFAHTVGTTAVALSSVTGLSGVTAAMIKFGVLLSVPSDNSGKLYLKHAASAPADTSNALLLQNGQYYTLDFAKFGGDLSKVFLIGSASGQVVTGEVL